MSKPSLNPNAHRATAIGLAAVITFTVMSSINLLAAPPAADSLFAAASAPAQTAVTEAHRLPKV